MGQAARVKQGEPGLSGSALPPVVQLFYNPNAGSANQRRLARLVAAFEAEGAAVLLAPSVDRVPEILPHATHICIAGGDGTVRHVAMALAKSGSVQPVAIYPAGTVNLLAREAPLPSDPVRFAHAVLGEGLLRPHHPITLGETMFFACASIGPDSAAVAGLSSRLKHRIGRAAYVVSFLRVLQRWRRLPLRLEAPGFTLECEAVYIAKARHFAGPWSFAPQARPDDELFHVVALHTARRRDFLRFVFALFTGRDMRKCAGMTVLSCSELSIDGPADMPVQADGDIVAYGPVRLSLHSFAANFR